MFVIVDKISDTQAIGFIISLMCACIAQLLYGIMLKDYINSVKIEK